MRSPPLRERRSKVRWPRWGNPEMARKLVFSEGRGLRVRVVRPHASRGIPFPPDHEARGRLAYRAHPSVKPVSSLTGVRSPPLRERRSKVTWPRGRNPGMTRKAVFSEGRTLCVRIERPRECRGIPFAADGLTMSRWPRGHMPRSNPCHPRGRAEPAPPRDGQAQSGLPGVEGPEMMRRLVLGGTHSVRPH